MTLRNGFPAVSDAADQFDIRAALRATTAQDANGNIKTGVSITAKSLTGLVTAGNGMNSDIAAFDAVTNRYGPVWLSNDGTISVKHAAAPSANSRIDLICIKQNETASPASDPTDGPEAIIVTGTPAVDPVTPATPEGALALARVTIPSTATSMTSTGVIYEQMYPFTASAGADLLFRSETEKDAWTPWEGQKCRLLDGNEYQAKSGVWVSLTHTDVTTLISGNYGTVKGYRSGPMVTLRIDWKTSASGSWNRGGLRHSARRMASPNGLELLLRRTRRREPEDHQHTCGRNHDLRQSGRHAGHERVRHDRLIRAMTRGVTARQCNRLNQCPEAMRRASGRRSSIRRCIPRTRCSDCQA